jgi:hypothetical protein
MLARAILILSCLLCTHGFARAQAPAANTPEASENTTTATGAQVKAESVESAVPVHREALEPVTEPSPKRPI